MADRLDVRRLAIVLGQLQSVHDHEVLNAARAATKMVREASTTWAALLGDAPTADTSPQQVIEHDERGQLSPPVGRIWADTVHFLCARRAGVTMYENELLDRLCRTLTRQRRHEEPKITADEAAWVTDIYDRIARPNQSPAHAFL